MTGTALWVLAAATQDDGLKLPEFWEYSAPLIAPEKRDREPSR